MPHPRPLTRRTLLAATASLTVPNLAQAAQVAQAAQDDATEIRVAIGNGIAYLPFHVGLKKGLFAAALARAGFPTVNVAWPRISGTSAMNDAMLSGSIDLYVAGIPGVLIVWDRTKGRSNAILGCAGVTTVPLSLVTVTDRIKSLADISPQDRIALPSIAGTPATVIRMACEQTFGPGQHGRLDRNMVALAHPDAMTALLNRSEITAYLGAPPFTDIIARDPRARVLLRSTDVFGGPSSFVLLSARKAYAERNPSLVAALVSGLQQAAEAIAADPREAAVIYLEAEPSRAFSLDLVSEILRDPATEFSTRPQGVMKTAEFMARVGELRTPPLVWTDVFVLGSHRLAGT